jgi:Holliday junction resolvase
MSASQRTKGARGERDAADALEAVGGRAWRRSASQSQGHARQVQEPDVVLVEPRGPWESVQGPEVKRTESASVVWSALRQAMRDAEGTARMPWVMWRRSRQPWLVVVPYTRIGTVVELLTGREVREPSGAVAAPDVRGKAPLWGKAWATCSARPRRVVVDREGYPVVVVCELSEIVEVARIVAGVEMLR